MALHFLKDRDKSALPQHIYTDLQSLAPLQDTQFEELVDILLRFLSQEGVDLATEVAAFSQQYGVPLVGLKKAISSTIYVFQSAIRANLNGALLQEDLVGLGLPEDKATVVGQKWRQKMVALSLHVMSSGVVVNQLVDLQWRFGVTAATSELAKAGTSYLQLKLVLDTGTPGQPPAVHHLELTLAQFYAFLHAMQKARATLDYFS